MALFKIFNNFDTKGSLPNTTCAGYCYFDATTNLFWIDIATTPAGTTLPTDNTSDDYRKYRVPLNAYLSDYAVRAKFDINGDQIDTTYMKLTDAAAQLGHTLTIGEYTFDGSANVEVPVYGGEYEPFADTYAGGMV